MKEEDKAPTYGSEMLVIGELSEAKARLVQVMVGLTLDSLYTKECAVVGIMQAIYFIDQSSDGLMEKVKEGAGYSDPT